MPGLSLLTWQCNAPLECDCTTHPLPSNERIRHCIFVRIPCWGCPFLSLSLSPPPLCKALCKALCCVYGSLRFNRVSTGLLTHAKHKHSRTRKFNLETPTHTHTCGHIKACIHTHKPRLHTAKEICFGFKHAVDGGGGFVFPSQAACSL